MKYRLAARADVPAMLDIYRPYVERDTASFEYEAPSPAAFAARFEAVTADFPWYVAEEGGAAVGFAYASRPFQRAAYQWDAELSIYLAPQARHKGIGSALYDRLEALMARLGYHNLYAIVTGDNAPSRRFHERRGYVLEGLLKKAGYKSGKWYDVYWYTLALAQDTAPTSSPKAFQPEKPDRDGHEKTEPNGSA